MNSVSVIVPVWNGRELLLKLLESIARQTCVPAEVLAVDNGSTDGAAEAVEAWGARVVRMGHNAGFAAAVNRGIAESRSEWLAILNSDVELEPEWLERLLAAEPQWFAVGKIVSAKNLERTDGSWDLVSRAGCAWRAGEGRATDFSAREIAMAPFTAVLVRAELFRRVGALDERFESYLEDVDFGLRCAAGGYRGLYIPEAVCRHRGSAALGRWHAESTRRISRNQMFLVAKHYPAQLRKRWRWPILIGQGLWGLVAWRHGAGWAWTAGKWEGWRRFRSMQEPGSPNVAPILASSERDIHDLQAALGFDWYWRLYFALVRRTDTGAHHD